jgi:hypothetical protein
MGVAVIEGQFPNGVPDTLQLYLLAEIEGDPSFLDSVLVGVAVAEEGETLLETEANVTLTIP